MANYPNFYENMEEMVHRLLNTVVKYADDFFSVHSIENNEDGIFRLVLDPLNGVRGEKTKMIKKMANSPHFNRFRPFPLGMANCQGKAFYLYRRPLRSRLQGLSDNALLETCVEKIEATFTGLEVQQARATRLGRERTVQWCSESMEDCFKGNYPTFEECIDAFKDTSVLNSSVAFHREFAIVKGFCGIIYLANKSGIVGFYREEDNTLHLNPKLFFLKESLEDLRLFTGGVVTL